jgi:UDP-glucose 4-epimerase
VNILIVGGAGYIGSHMVRYLLETGQNPNGFDNLSNGHRTVVSDVGFRAVDDQRRGGDSAELIADSTFASQEPGREPQFSRFSQTFVRPSGFAEVSWAVR